LNIFWLVVAVAGVLLVEALEDCFLEHLRLQLIYLMQFLLVLVALETRRVETLQQTAGIAQYLD
jgi:hypothetical protein